MATHFDKIKDLLDTCVKLTKAPGSHHKGDIEKLIPAILANHEETLRNAAKNGQTKAYIFVYALGAAGIYEYLFPNAGMLAALRDQNLDPVFLQIQKFFEPFVVEHKVFRIDPSGVVETTLGEDTYQLFCDGKLCDVKYVGAIIVSWSKFI